MSARPDAPTGARGGRPPLRYRRPRVRADAGAARRPTAAGPDALNGTSAPEGGAGAGRRRAVVTALALFLLAVVVFAGGFRYTAYVDATGVRYNGSGDTVPNELLPILILQHGTLRFDSFVDRSKPLDYFISYVDGHYVSAYPIVPGLFNIPVYAVAIVLGVDLLQKALYLSLLTSIVLSALSVALMYACLRRACRDERTAVGFALIYAGGTAVWSVASRGIWQHAPSLLLLNAALALLLSGSRRWLPFAGLALGLAVWNRPTNICLAAPLAVYVLLHHRPLFVRFAVLAAIPAALLAAYSLSFWGSLAALGQAHEVGGFSGHFWPGLLGLLFSPNRGLFVFSPIFVFAALGVWNRKAQRNDDPISLYLAFSVVALVLVYSKWSMWWGGHSFGYRLLIEAVPPLMLLLARAWEVALARRTLWRVAFAAALAWSVYVHALGATYSPRGFNLQPNDVDQHTERLWDVRAGELARCTARLAAGAGVATP